MSSILVDITHPAHFHFFRPAIEQWQERGYRVIIAAREKDVTTQLLDASGFTYFVLSRARRGVTGLARELLEHETRLLRLIRATRPCVILEVAGTFIVHAAFLARVPSLVFYDTEHARLSNAITFPFATKIFTPQCYRDEIGPKQIRYDGYQELAYLHPRYFEPDVSVLGEIGIERGEPYFVLRFVSWEASHDRGHHGLPPDSRRRLINMLEKRGRVVLSSEGPLPAEYERLRARFSPEKMHDALAFANLYVGEGGTMATEAALLGTPSVFVSTLESGNWDELRARYQLMFFYSEAREAEEKVRELLSTDNVKAMWLDRRQRVIADKVDVTEFLVRAIEPYCGERCI